MPKVLIVVLLIVLLLLALLILKDHVPFLSFLDNMGIKTESSDTGDDTGESSGQDETSAPADNSGASSDITAENSASSGDETSSESSFPAGSSEESSDSSDDSDSSGESSDESGDASDASESSESFDPSESSESIPEEDLPEDPDPFFEAQGTSYDDRIVPILSALIAKDFTTLSQYVSEEGLRLSPMGSLYDEDVIVSKDKVSTFLNGSSYKFGTYTGSGEPIRMTPSEYFGKFIVSPGFDFSTASCRYDDDADLRVASSLKNVSGGGTRTIHTICYTYEPNIMEYSRLILVFRTENGVDTLVCLIHQDMTTD